MGGGRGGGQGEMSGDSWRGGVRGLYIHSPGDGNWCWNVGAGCLGS